MTDESVSTEKRPLIKAAKTKRFENLPLGSELKRQTDVVGKQYSELSKIYEFDKKKSDDGTWNKEKQYDNKTPKIRKYNKSNLIDDSKHIFHKYQKVKEIGNFSFKSKNSFSKLVSTIFFFFFTEW